MVINLLQPLWLWGLLGLVVPIAIHLLHKRSKKVVLVGSLQPFKGGSPVQARRLQPNELWRLLLRCLLLALFVLLLTQPVWYPPQEKPQTSLFVAPELAAGLNIDSVKAAGFLPRLLQPGLPVLETSAPAAADKAVILPINYWEVFREIDTDKTIADTAWILFRPLLHHFRGPRPLLTKAFSAVPLAAPAEKEVLFAAVQQPEDKLMLRWWEQENGYWRIRDELVPLADSSAALAKFSSAVNVQAPDTLQVLLLADDEHQQEAAYWQQALHLIDSVVPGTVVQIERQASAEGRNAAEAGLQVWLQKATPLEAFLEASGEGVRIYLRQEQAGNWFHPHPVHPQLYTQQLSLQQQQNNRRLLADFIPQLLEVLPLKKDVLPPLLLTEDQWQPVRGEKVGMTTKAAGESLEKWVWLVLLAVFIVERWLSLQK